MKPSTIVLRLPRAQKARWVSAAQREEQTLAAFISSSADSEASRREHESRRWTAEMDAQLGTIPDSQLAEKLGITRARIAYRRGQLGIPPAVGRGRPRH